MDLISGYFPQINTEQKEKFRLMKPLYQTWNAKINLISRKDEEAFYLHHVLHSLSIARVIKFPEKSCVVDVGSGGGFPGIPLAVLFPDVEFVLLDSIQKKIRASENIGKTLDINNLSFVNERAENHNQQYDYIIARAVAAFPKFSRQTKHLIRKSGSLKRQGIYYLKGGDLADELKLFPEVQQFNISAFFPEPFFETKKVIYMPA